MDIKHSKIISIEERSLYFEVKTTSAEQPLFDRFDKLRDWFETDPVKGWGTGAILGVGSDGGISIHKNCPPAFAQELVNILLK